MLSKAFLEKLIEGLLIKEGVKEEHAIRIGKTLARILSHE